MNEDPTRVLIFSPPIKEIDMWEDLVVLGILQHEDFSDSRLWAAWYSMYPEAWKTKGEPLGIGWL